MNGLITNLDNPLCMFLVDNPLCTSFVYSNISLFHFFVYIIVPSLDGKGKTKLLFKQRWDKEHWVVCLSVMFQPVGATCHPPCSIQGVQMDDH